MYVSAVIIIRLVKDIPDRSALERERIFVEVTTYASYPYFLGLNQKYIYSNQTIRPFGEEGGRSFYEIEFRRSHGRLYHSKGRSTRNFLYELYPHNIRINTTTSIFVCVPVFS